MCMDYFEYVEPFKRLTSPLTDNYPECLQGVQETMGMGIDTLPLPRSLLMSHRWQRWQSRNDEKAKGGLGNNFAATESLHDTRLF